MDRLGTLVGFLGILVWGIAVVGRFYGAPTVYIFAATSVFSAGTALVVLGCFLKLFKK